MPVDLDPGRIAHTGMPWKEVVEKLQVARKRARSVWVLADTCRAAPGMRKELRANNRDLHRGIDPGGNLIVVTASSGDRPSFESEDLKHGIFTRAWLDALGGDAIDKARNGRKRHRAEGAMYGAPGGLLAAASAVKKPSNGSRTTSEQGCC